MSACAIDGRRLEIIRDSVFNSFIKPELDPEKCKLLGIDEVQNEALKVNGIDLKSLENSPGPKEVWERFCEYVNKFSSGTGRWKAPIRAGMNILGFDDKINFRLAKEFGPWDKEQNCPALFHPRDCIDIMHHLFMSIYENNSNVRSLSMDSMRDYFGLSKEKAHESETDILQGSMILIRNMKWMRKLSSDDSKFRGAMSNCKIEDFYGA